MKSFKTEVIKKYSKNSARVTKISTSHGEVITPAFMPVGTRAGVNCMTPQELVESNSQIILGGNTYHMLCAPGMEFILNAGGMHQMMGWQDPMLTDSGGFQVFSLSKNSEICVIDDNGATFKHPETKQVIHLNAESSLQAQKIIGADIIMAFDQCTPDIDNEESVIKIMDRTHRWLERSKEFHLQNPLSAYGYQQALFGIIQGGIFPHLREQSTKFILDMDLDGIAIGGETIGFDMLKSVEIIDWIVPMLPDNKTRYTMGVGLKPQDLIDVVAHGIDIFDCVAPTRNARHGSLYCGEIVYDGDWLCFVSDEANQQIQIKKRQYADDESPIMSTCNCYTCLNYSRAQLHHLYKQRTYAYSSLACIHNIHVMHEVCKKMRELILKD